MANKRLFMPLFRSEQLQSSTTANNAEYTKDRSLGVNENNYSRVTTCLTLCHIACAPNAETALEWLNDDKSIPSHHGLKVVHQSTGDGCLRYSMAYKSDSKELYIAFLGTDRWKHLHDIFKIYGKSMENEKPIENGNVSEDEETSESSTLKQVPLVPVTPFCHLLHQKEFKDVKLIFTGHSFGGAIAAIVAVNMLADKRTSDCEDRIACICFGAPYLASDMCLKHIGDKVNKHHADRFQFYTLENDIIPYLLTFVYNVNASEMKKSFGQDVDHFLEKLVAIKESKDVLLSKMTNECMKKLDNCSFEGKSLLEIARNQREEVLSHYKPFGRHYRSVSVSNQQGSTSLEMRSLEMKNLNVNYSPNIVLDVKNHLLASYVTDIYVNIISQYHVVSISDHAEISLREVSCDSNADPLAYLLTPEKEGWRPFKTDSFHEWSIVAEQLENNVEQINLNLKGPTVSFITCLECNNCVQAASLSPMKRCDYDDDVRSFIFRVPFKKDVNANDYRISIKTHFKTIDLTGLFDPLIDQTIFKRVMGLTGRKRQVADLSLFELYKLAFSFTVFTKSIVPNEVHERNRRQIEQLLAECEISLEPVCKEIEEYINKKKSDIFQCLKHTITSGESSDINLEESSTRELFTSFKKWLTLPFRRSRPGLTDLEFQSVTSAIKDCNTDKDGTEYSAHILRKVLPRQFTMSLGLSYMVDTRLNTFRMRHVSYAVTAVVSTSLIVSIAVPAIGWLLGAAIVGGSAVIGGALMTSTYLKLRIAIEPDYLKILVKIAESLGIDTATARMQPYFLEKEISDKYKPWKETCANWEKVCADGKKLKTLGKWKELFPAGELNSIRITKKRAVCLTVLQSIHTNFQMRELLSKDFAIGIIGPGKTGKSTLIQNMFGFKTGAHIETRTKIFTSYQVTENFRIVDFPHLTDTEDDISECFRNNHNFVYGLIVVLNAEQGGRDKKGEGHVIDVVKEITEEGFDVLYCFSKCDKLALKKQNKMTKNEFRLLDNKARSAKRTAVKENEQLQEIKESDQPWTAKDVEDRKLQWAKSYDLDIKQCQMIFSELEGENSEMYDDNYQKLKAIGLSSPSDIKKIWIAKVLRNNGLDNESVQKVMDFWYDEE